MSFSIEKRETNSLTIKSKSYLGFIFICLGLGAIYFFKLNAKPSDMLVFYIVGGLFTFIGLVLLLYKKYGEFNFLTRQYKYYQGWFFNLKKYKGSFDQIEYLALTIDWKTAGKNNSTKHPYWQVSIKLPGAENEFKLFESGSEKKANNWLEDKAKRFQVLVIDKTDPNNLVEKPWSELDQSILSKNLKYKNIDQSNPPEGVAVESVANGLEFWMKPKGLCWMDLPVLFIVSPFFVVGLGLILLLSGVLNQLGVYIPFKGSIAAGYVVGVVFF